MHRCFPGADIGIAMGALGSDAAIEAADIVLMDDDPLKISKAIRISRKCLRIVYENIYFAIGVKVVCLILGALGIANMWAAIFADVGVMIIAVLNAIRALNVKKAVKKMERTMQEKKKNWKWITVKKRRFMKNCSGSYRKSFQKEEELYDLAELYKVFGDSTRIRILFVLFEAEVCVCDLAAAPADDAVGDFPSAAHFKTE